MLLSREFLQQEYCRLGKTDRKIAAENNVTRTTVSRTRKQYGIATRLTTGRAGELLVLDRLRAISRDVLDMNEQSKTSEFDVLFKGQRIEVKTARLIDGHYRFQLGNAPEVGVVNAYKTHTGRTIKSYDASCDFFVFVCLDDNECFIVPPKHLKATQQTVTITQGGIYDAYKAKWGLLLQGGDPLSVAG